MAQRKFENLSDDELYIDWIKWLERSYKEVVDQAWNYRLFRLMRGVFAQNEQLQQTGGFLWDWMARNYTSGSAMAFRRELDTQGGTDNLFKLLNEIKKRPTVISRKRHRQTWGSELVQGLCDSDFERHRLIQHSENPELDHIDPAVVQDDLDELERRTKLVLDYVQATILHRTAKEQDKKITYGDFHEAVDAVDGMFKKYYVILTHRALVQSEPTAQYNEFEALTFPWIPDTDSFYYDQCK